MGRVDVASVSQRELERVYREQFQRLVRVASAITRDEAVGVEAVQEAFVRLLRARRGYRGEGAVEGWVWRTVVNEAKRLAGQERTRARRDRVDQPSSNGTGGADAGTRALIAALPERQRLALFLRYYADLDYRTIASVLEIEIGTVSATIAAAHQTLRTAMEGAVR
jgi:DNA-directed RNA polymerase specialized sigma24 family protein